jgi:hypothetical protein
MSLIALSSWELIDYMLRRIEAEFALILFMLAEMPVLVLIILAEMAAEFIEMLIMFA